jgi:glycosyltransferase involved in cell wall biosynthesis
MRIAHITNSYMPDRGYIEYYLPKKQQTCGHHVCVITTNHHSSRDKQFVSESVTNDEDGLTIFRLPATLDLFDNPIVSMAAFKKSLTKFSPDVVHIYSALSPLGFASVNYQKELGYKTVANVISGISPLLFRFPGVVKAFSTEPILKRINAYSACSSAVEHFLATKLGISHEKINLIPLGADAGLFRPDTKEKEHCRRFLGLTDENLVAVYTGKILPEKRIDDLLLASKKVIDKFSNFRLLLVGNGPSDYLGKLNSLIEKIGIKKHVITMKMVNRLDLPTFYNAADIAIWPGTFSISIVEAMSCGLPVIIAESNWTKHNLAYQNGYSFKAGDINRLSSILIELSADNTSRKSMGQRSRRLVEDKLSWDKIAIQYTSLYSKVLNKI